MSGKAGLFGFLVLAFFDLKALFGVAGPLCLVCAVWLKGGVLAMRLMLCLKGSRRGGGALTAVELRLGTEPAVPWSGEQLILDATWCDLRMEQILWTRTTRLLVDAATLQQVW